MSKHKSKKDKKKSGHVEANLTITRKEALNNDLEPIKYWDDWKDWRDGQRALGDDRSRIRPVRGVRRWYLDNCHIYQDNKKLKKKEQIRKLRKRKMPKALVV